MKNGFLHKNRFFSGVLCTARHIHTGVAKARPILGVMTDRPTAPNLCRARARRSHSNTQPNIYFENTFSETIWNKNRQQYCRNWSKVVKKSLKLTEIVTENGKSWRFYRKQLIVVERKKVKLFPIWGVWGTCSPKLVLVPVTHHTLPPAKSWRDPCFTPTLYTYTLHYTDKLSKRAQNDLAQSQK